MRGSKAKELRRMARNMALSFDDQNNRSVRTYHEVKGTHRFIKQFRPDLGRHVIIGSSRTLKLGAGVRQLYQRIKRAVQPSRRTV